MIKQAPPNENWCVGCSPDNCSGCAPPLCYFRRFDRKQRMCQYRPDGEPDPCHLIPKGRLARGGVVDVWESEWVVAGCRRHHHLFDGKQIRLKEDDYPQRFRDHAAKHGFYFAGERDGWRKRAG